MSVSQATGALVGHALGANNSERARSILRASILLCVLIMGSLGVLIIGFVEPIVTIFDVSTTGSVGTHSILWMKILGYAMPVFGVHIAFIGLFQGSGATRISLRINFWATIWIQIPLGWFLAFPMGLGAYGVWISFPIGFVLKAMLEFVAYKRGSWASLGVTPG